MTARPRPSLLALFDPLTISEEGSKASTRDAHSRESSFDSGSDKENRRSTTPTAGTFGGGGCKTQIDLLGSSFSSITLDAPTDDSSNLRLVQLSDELDSECKIGDVDDIILQRSQGPREPLSEILLIPSNGGNRTPQNMPRDKRLINLDSPFNSTTPKSLRKFAAGINNCDVFSSPASLRGSRTPQNSSPGLKSANVDSHTPCGDGPIHPVPLIPFTSQSPSLLSSTPVADPHPVFHDPPSNYLGSSIEFNDSSYIQQLSLTGNLLKDDSSFLDQMENDSLVDLEHGSVSRKSSDRTTFSSPSTPQDPKEHEVPSEPKANSLHAIERVKYETPARKNPAIFRRSSSVSSLAFGPKREEFSIALSSPVRLEPRTPSSLPAAGNKMRAQALAPKKAHAVLHRSSALSRSVSHRISQPVEEESYEEVEGRKTANATVRRPRPSSMEVRSNSKPQPSVAKHETATSNASPASGCRTSISRPATSLGRQVAFGRGVSPIRPKTSGVTQEQSQKPKPPQSSPVQRARPRSVLARHPGVGRSLSPIRPSIGEPKQDQTRKTCAVPLAPSARRLSVSTSSKPTPIETSNFATTGRLGGARRVPLTANAPLFKVLNSVNNKTESPKPKPILRPSATDGAVAPQKPVATGSSRILGPNTSEPKTSSLEKALPRPTTTRALGRTTSVSSATFTRSSFMTTSASSVASSSRLPVLPSKFSNRLAAPGARKPFH